MLSLRSTALLAVMVASSALALTCATSNDPMRAKYPPRGARCNVHVYNSPIPGVKEWDDLGVVRVDCPLDLGRVQCLRRLREEACRMGGDLLYDVPKKPARPSEQGMVYAGHVAHTRAVDGGAADGDSETAGGDQDGFDKTSPIEPLAPAPPAALPDAAARD